MMHDALDRSLSSLRAIAGRIETGFLDTGRDLESAIDAIRLIGNGFGMLHRQLEGGEVRSATDSFAAAAGRVSTIIDSLGRERAVLERLARFGAAIGNHIASMQGTLGAAGFLGINAKIAATEIAGEQADFSIYTAEIFRLLKLAQDSVQGIGRDLEAIGGHMKAAHGGQLVFEQRQGGALRAISPRLLRGIEIVAERSRDARSSASALESLSSDVDRQIGAVIMALQIGDATRQRLEHSEESLALVRTLSSGGAHPERDWWRALAQEEQAAVVTGACRLQILQIGHAADQFEARLGEIRPALEAVAKSVRSMLDLGRGAYIGEGGMAGGGRGESGTFFDEIGAQVGEARALIGGYGEARREVGTSITAAVDSVSNLGQHLKFLSSIEIDIRLMGLNVSLRCDRLGSRGRALSVIAQELRHYADRIGEDAGAVIRELGDINEAAAVLTRDDDAERSDADMLAQALEQSAGRLRALGQDLQDAFGSLERNADAVLSGIERTLARLAFRDEIAAGLRRCAADLEGEIQGSTLDATRMDALEPRIRALFGEHYTMAGERGVHAAFAHGGSVSEPAAAEVETLDDILF